MIHKIYLQTVGSEGPIENFGDGFEIVEEGYGAGEKWKLVGGDRRETGIVESTRGEEGGLVGCVGWVGWVGGV